MELKLGRTGNIVLHSFTNEDELNYCFDCKTDNLGTLTWMCLGGEPRILEPTAIEKCMDCGGKNFRLKESFSEKVS